LVFFDDFSGRIDNDDGETVCYFNSLDDLKTFLSDDVKVDKLEVGMRVQVKSGPHLGKVCQVVEVYLYEGGRAIDQLVLLVENEQIWFKDCGYNYHILSY